MCWLFDVNFAAGAGCDTGHSRTRNCLNKPAKPVTNATLAYLFRPAHTGNFLILMKSEHPFWLILASIIQS
jgi:hypothetical protein